MKLPELKKIGIFRALHLSDLICITPALRTIRFAHFNAEIVFIGLPWAVSFANRFSSYIDRFIPCPQWSDQLSDANTFEAFEELMKEENFDLLIQMHDNGIIVNQMLSKWNAVLLSGFFCACSRVDSELFIEYPETKSEIHRHLLLTEHLGMVNQGDHLDFPLLLKDYNELDALQLNLQAKKYILINPGASDVSRRWPPAYFAMVGDYCFNKGFTIVITGTTEERHITSQVAEHMQRPFIDLTGSTSLGALGVLLSDAFLLIANCTAMSHLAFALDVPSVTVTTGGDPQHWSQNETDIHKVIDLTLVQEFEKVLYATVDLIHELELRESLVNYTYL